VHVGLYFDLRNPPQWRVDSSRLYGFTLEMCEEADRLGCHSLWFSEHHLFDDGYLPQPLTFAAAVAARTRSARLGTAVLIAPLHKQVEIAEQAAIVDIVSGGRLDLGIGAGYRPQEFRLFGADLSRRYGATDECARSLRRLWSDGGVTPAPVQERLPIWMGYQGRQGAARAGSLGELLLSPAPELWPIYRDALVAAGHDPADGRMAGVVQGWVTNDPDGDWPMVSEHLSNQVDSYRRMMVQGTDRPVPRPVDPNRMRASEPNGALSYFAYGTPAEMADWVRGHTAGAPVETVYFWASLSGMPEDVVAEFVRVVCTELAPLLAGYDPMAGLPAAEDYAGTDIGGSR
jgi:alkanesulfonate monooxygenase SsuD/methylene tetrahydromethanopterin reductase-like flavin-dependent oxidoreductase (luciferase family)